MILVTGSGGVLGSALYRRLRALEEPVTALTSGSVDLRDRERTIEFIRSLAPRMIYHLAGKVHGLGGNGRYPADMFVDNIRINTNVIEAAQIAGCEKIVAASTVAIYASEAPKPVAETAIWMGEPHGSERAYGHAKRAMLAQLQATRAQYGLDFAYPILTNIYGPDDRFDPVNGHVVPSLVAKFAQAARDGGSVSIWGTGRAERDFIFADDAASALMLAGRVHDGAVNVATGSVVRIRDLVQALADHSGVSDVEWDATKPDGQIERFYDVGALAGLGFRPEVSLQDGIKRTYDWYVAHYPDVRT